MKTAGDTAPSLCLYYSKPRAFLVLTALLAIVLWLAYLVLAGALSGQLVLLITGVAATLGLAPAVVPMFVQNLVALQSSTAVVVFDERGISDSRKKEPFLGWEDIGKMSLGFTQPSRSHLIIDFRNAAVAKSTEQSGFTFWTRRLAAFGDWHVNLRPLRCRDEEVLRKAQRLHQDFIRRQVVRENGSATNGWSGKL